MGILLLPVTMVSFVAGYICCSMYTGGPKARSRKLLETLEEDLTRYRMRMRSKHQIYNPSPEDVKEYQTEEDRRVSNASIVYHIITGESPDLYIRTNKTSLTHEH